ncbi:unnamed protein product [Discula destructiva]
MSTISLQQKVLQQLCRPPSPRCLLHHGATQSVLLSAQTPPRAPSSLSRRFSTSPCPRQEAPSSAPSTQAPLSPEPTQLPPPRRRRRLFSAAIFLLVGAAAGTVFRVVVSPPPPLPPGEVDDAMKADIRALAEQLPIVQQLLAEPGWTHHEAYAAIPTASRPLRMTTGPLDTSAAIGAYQHIFHPPATTAATDPIINIIHLGLSTTGWPGVVHGGLLSTIMDEHSARAALAEVKGRHGVLTANLDLTYKRPTLAGGFYAVKARALREDELAPAERGKRARKVWVDVWLETIDGVECVRGRGLFVIPKGRALSGFEQGF